MLLCAVCFVSNTTLDFTTDETVFDTSWLKRDDTVMFRFIAYFKLQLTFSAFQCYAEWWGTLFQSLRDSTAKNTLRIQIKKRYVYPDTACRNAYRGMQFESVVVASHLTQSKR